MSTAWARLFFAEVAVTDENGVTRQVLECRAPVTGVEPCRYKTKLDMDAWSLTQHLATSKHGMTKTSPIVAEKQEQKADVCLELRGAHIVGFVADNAANMQAAMRHVAEAVTARAERVVVNVVDNEEEQEDEEGEEEEEEDEGAGAPAPQVAEEDTIYDARNFFAAVRLHGRQRILFNQRCFAHTLQLCVDDVIKSFRPWKDLLAHTLRAKAMTKTKTNVVATRWNSLFLVIQSCLANHHSPKHKMKIIDHDLVNLLTTAEGDLRPFFEATNKVQRGQAVLWDAAEALQLILQVARLVVEIYFSRNMSSL